ncbi:AAA domain-containing protein [Brevibacillus brevis]|uniref:AAA domain-containing protein n=1 Tax=Brevibacillus brevis TaxID=1393 RepID=UPI000D10072D|nr:AAA domain-containing protein [Brevibacillus brevis]PSJ65910.1 hypothetical protein C7J99_28020 [Brevibacillus brevis]RED27810.1 AAA domain-containing protein [Brevibacillus brevis]GEC88650.1 DNA helicase [Brevibacillus brevis]VEF86848.1 putative DNA helicase [Brevibacillus brevis]
MKVITYWRNSLADADRLNLDLSKLSSPKQIAFSDIERGTLPPAIVEAYFSKDKYKEEQVIDVLLAPVVAYIKTEHGATLKKDLKVLVPLWVPAKMHKEGQLQVKPDAFPWIPRNFLEPCSSDIIPIGKLESMDVFLSSHRQPEENWTDYWNYALNLFCSVTGQALSAFEHEQYMRWKKAFVSDESVKRGMSKNIIELYDDIRRKKYIPPLLKSYASLEDTQLKPLLDDMDSILQSGNHLGQMSNVFPVSESQRETIHHFLTLNEGEILAVNGPPGTGKTTMLQSVVSTLWIKAAYEQTEPPVIVVTSTNNQAVTNVIDSFGKITEKPNSLEGRWIPNVHSYGLYLSSISQDENPGFQTVYPYQRDEKKPRGFTTKLETQEYVADAEKLFLEKSSSYAKKTFTTVKEAVEFLHGELKQTVDEQRQLIKDYHEFLHINKIEQEKYPQGIEKALADKRDELEQIQYELNTKKQTEIEWNKHLYSQPWWMTKLNFFPLKGYVDKKRRLRNKIFMLSYGYDEMEEDEFTTSIQTSKKNLQRDFDMAQEEFELVQKDQQWYQNTRNVWNDWKNKLRLNEEEDLLSRLDSGYRYNAFKLATHYWEGRWILQMQNEFSTNYEDSRGEAKQKTRWRRNAKLTPCFVSTLFMTPSFFKAYQGESIPLYKFIDLLIIDEAGQVSPEIAGATFALAKKALVVGDTLQIEPVWNIPKSIDLKNMEKFKLASTYDDAEKTVLNKYIGASNGTVMHIAQRASKYQKYNEARGMYLTEHRRCVPEIIGYCNRLAYKGRLLPKRGSESDYPLPHLGYAHVQGVSEKFSGSNRNRIEADVIVNWILDNQERLIKMYEDQKLSKIEDIIAVVTPFTQQRQLIQTALKRAEIKDMKVGTVHALQGAERPIVIFSPVYDSSTESGYFFDNGVNMMNVAVSRAKDSFLVFGDMQIFDSNASTPSGLLARYLFADEANEIKNIRISSRALSNLSGAVHHIRELGEHRRVLKECIRAAKKEIHIVSPFMSSVAIEADGLLEVFADTIRNGTQVTIYTDEKLNEQNERQRNNFVKAKESLQSAGVKVVVANRIHNKTLWVDNRLLIEGSFNWLSARRSPNDPWCRYETSLVYKGDGVEQMIQQICSDLEKRKVMQMA